MNFDWFILNQQNFMMLSLNVIFEALVCFLLYRCFLFLCKLLFKINLNSLKWQLLKTKWFL